MNKRLSSFLFAFTLILGLCACGPKETAPTWQEQYDLGIRYLSEGNYEEAIIAFTTAIEIDPKHPEAYVGRGDAYLAMGDEDAATENYALAVEYGDGSAQDKLDALKQPEPLEGYPKSVRSETLAWGYSITDYNEYGNLAKLSIYTTGDDLNSYSEYVYDERQTLTMIVEEYFALSSGTPGKSVSYIDPQGRCYKSYRTTSNIVVSYDYSGGTNVQITYFDGDFFGSEAERNISYTMQDPSHVVIKTMMSGSLREHSIVVEEYQVTDTYYSGPKTLVRMTGFVFDEDGTLLRSEPMNG